MVGVNLIAAETDEKAHRLATSQQRQFLQLLRGRPEPLHPPVDDMDEIWLEHEKAAIERQLRSSIIGSPATVKKKLEAFLDETQADEMIINTQVYDHRDRLRSFEIVKDLATE